MYRGVQTMIVNGWSKAHMACMGVDTRGGNTFNFSSINSIIAHLINLIALISFIIVLYSSKYHS